MFCERDDEVPHRLGRHHVWAALGAAEARKVHQDQWAKLLDRGQDSAKAIDALRPRAGQEDGDTVGSAARARRILRPPICEVVTRPMSGRLPLIEGFYESLLSLCKAC